MNVKTIEKLSEEHRALINFSSACKQNEVELTVKQASGAFGEASLGYRTTNSIIVAVRKAVLKRIETIEVEIKKEAAK